MLGFVLLDRLKTGEESVQSVLDSLVREMSTSVHNDHSRPLLIIWPGAIAYLSSIRELLSGYFHEPLLEISFNLNRRQLGSLVQLVYSGHLFVSHDGNVLAKAREEIGDSKRIPRAHVILCPSGSQEKMVPLKAECRALWAETEGIGGGSPYDRLFPRKLEDSFLIEPRTFLGGCFAHDPRNPTCRYPGRK